MADFNAAGTISRPRHVPFKRSQFVIVLSYANGIINYNNERRDNREQDNNPQSDKARTRSLFRFLTTERF